MELKMTGYQDQWTRMHDRTRGSNNGWMYTAETLHVAPELIAPSKLIDCWTLCTVSSSNFNITVVLAKLPLHSAEMRLWESYLL